jgi:AraC-like DNA-binding protein
MRPLPPDDVFRRLAVLRDWLLSDPAAAPAQEELARRAGMSRFHFLRRWKEAFGVTPHEDLTRLRIARAKWLLATDRASVTEVCFEVGFSSLGSFSTLFAERVGCPPSAWRRYYQVTSAIYDRSALVIPWCFSYRLAGVGG